MEFYTIAQQFVDLSDVRFEGSILDIGGGGEGVISRHSGQRVVAIDKRKDELEETPDIGLKIIMNACEMGFLDKTFDNITCFFALMYMKENEAQQVLGEAYRVLKSGGRLWIWDVVMPSTPTAEVLLVPLEVVISPLHKLTPTYGISWFRGQSAQSVRQACEEIGFMVECCMENGSIFAFILRKSE